MDLELPDRLTPHLFRHWWTHPSLLAQLRKHARYGPGENRATGYLYIAGDLDWPDGLTGLGEVLRQDLTRLTGEWFTVVAFQGYRDGSGVGWHDDANFAAQAILSLGATRTFGIRRKPAGEPHWMTVADGDLLYLPAGFQQEWEHCVPTEDIPGERISLVFRTVAEPGG